MRPALTSVAAAVVLLLAAAPSIAQGVSEDRRAADLYSEARVHYRAGRFAEAVRLLKEAHQLRPDPVLLYNLGRVYESMGDLAGALASYREFLRATRHVPDRGAIEQRI